MGQEITHDTGTHKGCFQFCFHALTFTSRQLPPEPGHSRRVQTPKTERAQIPQAWQGAEGILPKLAALHTAATTAELPTYFFSSLTGLRLEVPHKLATTAGSYLRFLLLPALLISALCNYFKVRIP